MWLIRWFSRRRSTGATLPDIIYATLRDRTATYGHENLTPDYRHKSHAPVYTLRYRG